MSVASISRKVVNKYIGETEKNSLWLFDAAEASGVILFLDEAGALFGKLTHVDDDADLDKVRIC